MAKAKTIVVLEGGPGVGKTSVASLLRERLEKLGRRACIVDDAVRGIAPLLAKLFGKWYNAPRNLIEYMFLGYQLRRLHECLELSPDYIILDYGFEAALAYMEAEGVSYPSQLERLAEAMAPEGWRVKVFILEQPAGYNVDLVRWEDPRTAQRYSRRLVARAASLAGRIGAEVYVVPEKPTLEERVELILSLLE